ncbi:MAG: hypothetical protein SFY32_01655 [Bacteroidota bacterium]|nr:hypothetical protein [Bacteroidota bacterium]
MNYQSILLTSFLFISIVSFSQDNNSPKTTRTTADIKKIISSITGSNSHPNEGFRLYTFSEDFTKCTYLWFSSGKEVTPSFHIDRSALGHTFFLPKPDTLEKSEIGENLISAVFPEGGALAFSLNIASIVTRKKGDTIVIFTPKRKAYDGQMSGIRSFFTPFRQLLHVWQIPDGYYFHDYNCNRPGKWTREEQTLTYLGTDVNNLVFDIKVLPNHLNAGKLSGRSVEYLHTVFAKGNSFELTIYDPAVEDKDAVSVFFNGEKVISNLVVTQHPASFILPLTKMENRLVVYIEDTGKYDPNTTAIKINEMDTPLLLSPDLEHSQGVIIKKKIGK